MSNNKLEPALNSEPDPYCNLPDIPAINNDAPPSYSASEQRSANDVRSIVLDPRSTIRHSDQSNGDVHITSINQNRQMRDRSLAMAYLLAGTLGFLGAHHFYMGRPRFGILYIFTFGLFGLGWLTDLIRLPWILKQANSRRKNPATYFEAIEDRDTFYVYLMWIPLGFIGAHQYYLRRWKWAVLYTFTAGLFGIGWLVDAFRIPHLTKDTNRKLAEERSESQVRGPKLKKLGSAYLMWIPPLGFLGGHQYYLGRKGFGALYTCTGGLALIGWLVDGCRMPYLVKRVNRKLEEDYQKASEGQFVVPDNEKHVDDAYLLHFGPFGILGASQFYIGRYPWAVAYLFTAGFFGIGWIVEMFMLCRHVKEANQKAILKDQVRIEYGPNTQIIVVTDGRVVAEADTGATGPVVLPAISVPGPLGISQPFDGEQPPSYESVAAELAEGGATGGSDNVSDAIRDCERGGDKTKEQDAECTRERRHQEVFSHSDNMIKTESSVKGNTNTFFKRSPSQEDHFYGVTDSMPEKRQFD